MGDNKIPVVVPTYSFWFLFRLNIKRRLDDLKRKIVKFFGFYPCDSCNKIIRMKEYHECGGVCMQCIIEDGGISPEEAEAELKRRGEL